MSLWTLTEIAAAVGSDASVAAAVNISGVSIDTRTLQPGDLFVALEDARDGHTYIDAAHKAGAAAVMVHKPLQCSLPQITVENTFSALQQLGQAARLRHVGLRVALTGSCGKTGSKELLAAALQGHKSVASYNNHFGVPLTLARMPQDAPYAVFEVGMNAPGEIAPLSRQIQPQVAMVLNVPPHPPHLEAFNNRAELVQEKLSVDAGLGEHGVLVLPPYLQRDYKGVHTVVTFSDEEPADIKLLQVDQRTDGTQSVTVQTPQGRVTYVLALPGHHHVVNSLGVLAVLHALKVPDINAAAQRMSTVQPQPGRGVRHLCGDVLIIDESYNANPASMAVMLRDFSEIPVNGRRIALLADMLELGETSAACHAELAEATNGLDGVVAVGPQMAHLYEALPQRLKMGHYMHMEHFDAEAFTAMLNAGDAVAVKGSNAFFWKRGTVPQLCDALSQRLRQQKR